jgi:hypothetical protein
VDTEYQIYLGQRSATTKEKVIHQLTYYKQVCEEMYEESDEAMKEMVTKRRNNDTLDMPLHLLEVQDTVGEEVVRQYFKNYRQQM